MSKLEINGGTGLNGIIDTSGAKNAALPLMVAAILTPETVKFNKIPNLKDVEILTELLQTLGVKTSYNSTTKKMELNAENLTSYTASYELVSKMRASILVLGPLVARFKEAKVSLPGGCAIGTRPVDLHLEGLKTLGAEIELEGGYVIAKAPKGLIGSKIHLSFPSVGATENLLMAATLAKGTTIITNAAKEPEIVDLGECLIKMGAEIEGLGTDTLTITGKDTLKGTEHTVVADRIEAGTFILAGIMAGGDLKINNARLEHLESLTKVLRLSGIDLVNENGLIITKKTRNRMLGIDVMTEPYPGFPTDLQAQIMTVLSTADGAGMVTETVFENRFMHVPELIRMGANITIHGSSALIRGVPSLKCADVMATDLRASASLVMAGIATKGKTTVHSIEHLERGYEDIVEKLSAVGANLRKLA